MRSQGWVEEGRAGRAVRRDTTAEAAARLGWGPSRLARPMSLGRVPRRVERTGVCLRGPEEALERLGLARDRLDRCRLRPSLGWKTAADYDASLPPPPPPWSTARPSIELARSAQERAMLATQTDRERRFAERRATLATLVCCRLIAIYRGGAPRVAKPETIP